MTAMIWKEIKENNVHWMIAHLFQPNNWQVVTSHMTSLLVLDYTYNSWYNIYGEYIERKVVTMVRGNLLLYR